MYQPVSRVERAPPCPAGIVYVLTRKDAETLAEVWNDWRGLWLVWKEC